MQTMSAHTSCGCGARTACGGLPPQKPLLSRSFCLVPDVPDSSLPLVLLWGMGTSRSCHGEKSWGEVPGV